MTEYLTNQVWKSVRQKHLNLVTDFSISSQAKSTATTSCLDSLLAVCRRYLSTSDVRRVIHIFHFPSIQCFHKVKPLVLLRVQQINKNVKCLLKLSFFVSVVSNTPVLKVTQPCRIRSCLAARNLNMPMCCAVSSAFGNFNTQGSYFLNSRWESQHSQNKTLI